MSRKEHKVFKKCPYCGETLYEDEMCRCRFDDEFESAAEVNVDVVATSKSDSAAPLPKAPVAEFCERFCKRCGAPLIPGRACTCSVMAHTRPTGVDASSKSTDTSGGIKINMRSSSDSGAYKAEVNGASPYASKADSSSSTTRGGGLKSTMRHNHAPDDAASKKAFNPTGREFLSKPDDF